MLGRGDKLDLLHAALVNGISSHVFDFDDTHLKTIIHPAGPVALGVFAAAFLPAGYLVGAGAWALHIAVDRVAGYGLRTPDGFQRA